MTNKMIANKIAAPYAQAFFQLILDLYMAGPLDSPLFYQLMFDIDYIRQLLEENPPLVSFLQNPLNPDEAKKEVLQKCIKRRIHPATVNFLHFLVDKKRINILEEISQKFMEKAYDFVCLRVVEVSSPVDLTKKQRKTLTKKVRDMIGPIFTEPFAQSAHIELVVKIDPTILGGLIIKVKSKVIDLSLRGELQRIAKELNVVL